MNDDRALIQKTRDDTVLVGELRAAGGAFRVGTGQKSTAAWAFGQGRRDLVDDAVIQYALFLRSPHYLGVRIAP